MVSNETVAHDLAISYIRNRYGTEAVGKFNISGSEGSVYGEGEVKTLKLPGPEAVKIRHEKTGIKKGFGPFKYDVTIEREDGLEIDYLFIDMVKEYKVAYVRFLHLLEQE